MGRILRSLLVFLAVVMIAPPWIATWLGASSNLPGGTTRIAALAGLILGLVAALAAWHQSTGRTTSTERQTQSRLGWPRAKSGDPLSKGAIIGRTLFVFVFALLLAMAVLSSSFDQETGAWAFNPRPGGIGPVIMFALLASALALRDALRQGKAAAPKAAALEDRAAEHVRAGLAAASNRGAGFVGWLLAFLAKVARLLSRGFGAYRSRGMDETAPADWMMLGALFVGGCLFFFVALLQSAGAAFLIATLMFGATAAIAHDWSISSLLRFGRLPRLRDGLLLLICTLTLLCLVPTIGILLQPLHSSPDKPLADAVAMTGRILTLLAALLVVSPMFVAIWRPMPEGGGDKPLWPLFAGFFGGGVCWSAGALAWSAIASKVSGYYYGWPDIALDLLFLPGLALILGASGYGWLQALTATRREGLDWSGVFPASIRSCMFATALVLLLCLSVLFVPTREGEGIAAFCCVIASAAWIYALRQIEPMLPSDPLRAIAVIVLLFVLLPLSYGLSVYIRDAHEWAILLVFFTMPFAAGSWLFVALVMPRLAARILQVRWPT